MSENNSKGIEMLPLPEWCHGCGESLPRDMQSYARAVAEHNVAARDAEVEALRAEVADARDGWHMANGAAELAMKHRDAAEARAERLAEALREARRALAWAAERLPEMEPHYEAADRALRDHDQEGNDG